MTDRKCTDLSFLVLFLATTAAMVGLSVYGFTQGNVHKLIGGIDGDHKICGASQGYEAFQNLYITDLGRRQDENIFASAVCVKACPSTRGAQIDCVPTSLVPECNSPAAQSTFYSTVSIAGYCFPKDLEELPAEFKTSWNKAVGKLKDSQAGQLFSDMQTLSVQIYSSLLLGVVYSVGFIFLMSRFATCLAYIALGIIEFFILAAAAGCFLMATQKDVKENDKQGLLIFGGFMLLLAVLYNLILWCKWRSIKVAIAVIDATADFFAATTRIVLTSVAAFVITLVVILIWTAGVAGVVSLNNISASTTSAQGKIIVWEKNVSYMLAFMFFGLIWVVFWL